MAQQQRIFNIKISKDGRVDIPWQIMKLLSPNMSDYSSRLIYADIKTSLEYYAIIVKKKSTGKSRTVIWDGRLRITRQQIQALDLAISAKGVTVVFDKGARTLTII